MGVKESILPLKWKDQLLPNSRRGAVCSKHKYAGRCPTPHKRNFSGKVSLDSSKAFKL